MNEILQRALEDHNPRRVVALTSGGMDSTAALIEAREVVDFAAYIDTGTALPGCEEHVQSVCDSLGVELRVYRTPPSVYDNMVLEHGFPGAPQHTVMYRNLKERRVRDLVREEKEAWKDRIMLVTGVRASESLRRMGVVSEVQRNGAQLWTAPIIEWSGSDTFRSAAAHGVKRSEVSAITHRSGECNCGAYAKPGERDELAMWFPEWFERIAWLERKTRESGKPCVWGAGNPKRKIGGRPSVGPMCVGCEGE